MTQRQESAMEIAVQLYNDNCEVMNLVQIKNIFLALKKFIAINQSFSDREDAILPRVFSFIALCNYKMGNFDRSYWCAKRSVELGDAAMENSAFTANANLYVDPEVYNLLDVLENDHQDDIDFNRGYQEGEENIYEDTIVRNLLVEASVKSRPSEGQIRGLIQALSKIQENASAFFESQGDGFKAFQYNQMIEAFKMPLYCAWQAYKYGWHTDFMEEGDSLFPYLMFESKAEDMLNDLIRLLKDESPFAMLERNGAITNGLTLVFSRLLRDIKSEVVKL